MIKSPPSDKKPLPETFGTLPSNTQGKKPVPKKPVANVIQPTEEYKWTPSAPVDIAPPQPVPLVNPGSIGATPKWKPTGDKGQGLQQGVGGSWGPTKKEVDSIGVKSADYLAKNKTDSQIEYPESTQTTLTDNRSTTKPFVLSGNANERNTIKSKGVKPYNFDMWKGVGTGLAIGATIAFPEISVPLGLALGLDNASTDPDTGKNSWKGFTEWNSQKIFNTGMDLALGVGAPILAKTGGRYLKHIWSGGKEALAVKNAAMTVEELANKTIKGGMINSAKNVAASTGGALKRATSFPWTKTIVKEVVDPYKSIAKSAGTIPGKIASKTQSLEKKLGDAFAVQKPSITSKIPFETKMMAKNIKMPPFNSPGAFSTKPIINNKLEVIGGKNNYTSEIKFGTKQRFGFNTEGLKALGKDLKPTLKGNGKKILGAGLGYKAYDLISEK